MIARPGHLAELRAALKRSRIVGLIGPRQCGKTTLARWIVPADSHAYFDLEDPASLTRLDEPMTALRPLRGIVVIDEVQRRPDLFPVLRVLADRRPNPAKFLILGSASPELMRQSSESLAGRIEIITLGGLSLEELGAAKLERHWRRGGFPPAFLARTEADSVRWRQQFIQTFLERDLAQMGVRTPATTLLRFWTLIAHAHGGIWNASDVSRSLGMSQPTARQYLDLMAGLFMLRQLVPWHENLGKRQVRSPKVYVRDSGLLHQLVGIRSDRDLATHPRSGASWEGYAIEEVLKRLRPDEAYFWATHAGAELDLLVLKDGRRYGFEMKRQDAPRLSASMQIALEDLRLDRLTVLYPGTRAYELSDRVGVVPLAALASESRDDLIRTALPGTRKRPKRRRP